MSGQTAWAVVIVIVVAAAVIGFFLGRASASGSRQRTQELEAEVHEHKRAVETYKREVEQHFDKTASLFVSMAGSYKELFEHLSSGYAKLSDGEDKDLFRQHVATMLLDGPKDEDGHVVDGEQSTPAATDDQRQSSAEQGGAAEEAAQPYGGATGDKAPRVSETNDSPATDSRTAQTAPTEATADQPARLSPEEQKESEIRGVAPPHSAPMEEAAAERALRNSAVDQARAYVAESSTAEEKKS